jgi:hypothetical protein
VSGCVKEEIGAPRTNQLLSSCTKKGILREANWRSMITHIELRTAALNKNSSPNFDGRTQRSHARAHGSTIDF